MSTMLLAARPAAIAPLGAGILRTLQVEFQPICDGRELMSPDEFLIARALSTYGPHSSGGSKSYYEFVVENRAGRRLQYVEIPVKRDELINWRLEGSIVWADDGSAVTFEFQRTSLTLLIDCGD
jgi:hypothetical protein